MNQIDAPNDVTKPSFSDSAANARDGGQENGTSTVPCWKFGGKTEESRRRQLAALRPTQWQAGESGNRAGRPRASFQTVVGTILAQAASDGQLTEEDVTRVVRTVVDHAVAGNMRKAKLVLDRIMPIPRRKR